MATPTIDKLVAYLPTRNNVVDGAAIQTFTCMAGSTAAVIKNSWTTEAAGTWNGALGWFLGDTLSPALRGVFFHVRTQAPQYLTLAQNLPAVPQANDSFRLILGGNFRTSHEAFMMMVAGKNPELIAVAGANITGLTIQKASPMLGAGSLEIAYNATTHMMAARMGAEPFGSGVDVSIGGGTPTNYLLYTDGDAAWVYVTVTATSLPVADQNDTWAIADPDNTFTPDYEAYETAAGTGGKIRYRLEIVKNVDLLNTMLDPRVYSDRPSATATTLTGALGTAAGTVDTAAEMTTWPESGFWVENTTKSDCRFVTSRTGLTLSCAASKEWIKIKYVGGFSGFARGRRIRQGTSAIYATIHDFTITTGSLGSSTATGYILANKADAGWLGFNAWIYVEIGGVWSSGPSLAQSVVYGLRDRTAVNWEAGDAIRVMSDVDLKINRPADQMAPEFWNPGGESIVPARTALTEAEDGFLFSHAVTQGEAISLEDDLRPQEVCGVWRREWIMDAAPARADLTVDTVYSWS